VPLYSGPELDRKVANVTYPFNSILYNEQHVLHRLLPERHNTNYRLRLRRHDRTLSSNTDRRNFIHRITFKDMY